MLAIALGLVALLLWVGRDTISSQLASCYRVTVGLKTPTDHDKERLERAFAAVRTGGPCAPTLDAATDRYSSSTDIMEIRIWEAAGTFRVIYIASLRDAV